MTYLEMTVSVGDDRKLVVQLPPEVPSGELSVTLAIEPVSVGKKRSHTNLAEWARTHAKDWGPGYRSDDVEGFTGRSR